MAARRRLCTNYDSASSEDRLERVPRGVMAPTVPVRPFLRLECMQVSPGGYLTGHQHYKLSYKQIPDHHAWPYLRRALAIWSTGDMVHAPVCHNPAFYDSQGVSGFVNKVELCRQNAVFDRMGDSVKNLALCNTWQKRHFETLRRMCPLGWQILRVAIPDSDIKPSSPVPFNTTTGRGTPPLRAGELGAFKHTDARQRAFEELRHASGSRASMDREQRQRLHDRTKDDAVMKPNDVLTWTESPYKLDLSAYCPWALAGMHAMRTAIRRQANVDQVVYSLYRMKYKYETFSTRDNEGMVHLPLVPAWMAWRFELLRDFAARIGLDP